MMSLCSNFPTIKAFFPRTENIYQPQTANDSLTSLKKLLKLTRFTRCHLSQSYISSKDCGKRGETLQPGELPSSRAVSSRNGALVRCHTG